jgi:hypothetical protein
MKRQSFLRRLIRKVDKTVASWFFIDQWIILAGTSLDYRALGWRSLNPLIPPRDRYWGDPFPWQNDGCRYVFIEEKLYAAGRGRIACLALGDHGQLLSQQVVLERPYHLSYPFLFEHDQALYMVPETAEQRTVELYRCTHLPDRWEFVRNLLNDVYAVDATLLQHAGMYWLFANVKEPGGSSLDSLHLYLSDDPLNGTWRAHPLNPVVNDLAGSRPAGRIFVDDGKLIRPAQDNSRRYGGALKFQRIETLTETDYAEATERLFTPAGSRYRAVHTFNQAGDLTVVDAVLRRRK